MWLLIVVAVLAAGWWRRGSTFVLIVMASSFAFFVRFWPEHSVWNTRYLPLYYLSIAMLAAVGAAELMRIAASVARWSYDWIREGDRLDAFARNAPPADESAGAAVGQLPLHAGRVERRSDLARVGAAQIRVQRRVIGRSRPVTEGHAGQNHGDDAEDRHGLLARSEAVDEVLALVADSVEVDRGH